ncbi:MAG TPA: ABC transporter substrate-binding protein [Methylococcaceae bacterium]|nr:ABC transporter substrate-binding protein [Methylococcaceae bacterium]
MKFQHLTSTLFMRLCLGVILAAWSLAGQAEALTPAQLVVQSTSDTLQRELQKDEYKRDFVKATQFVDHTIEPSVDFDRVSALALGKHWKTATPVQKDRFKKEFRTLLVRTYTTAFTEYANWKIRYLPMLADGESNKVLVKTEILQEGAQPSAVDYRMINSGGMWKVYDVLIEGISLLQNYRTEFGQEITQTGSLDGVIDRIAKRNSTALKEPLKAETKAPGA